MQELENADVTSQTEWQAEKYHALQVPAPAPGPEPDLEPEAAPSPVEDASFPSAQYPSDDLMNRSISAATPPTSFSQDQSETNGKSSSEKRSDEPKSSKKAITSSTGFKVGVPIAASVLLAAAVYVLVVRWKQWKRRVERRWKRRLKQKWKQQQAKSKVHDWRVYTEGKLKDTFDNTSVGESVQEWRPRQNPPTPPADSSVQSKLIYMEKQLDCFGVHDSFYHQYSFLGPDHRFRGGVSPYSLVSSQVIVEHDCLLLDFGRIHLHAVCTC